MHSPPGHFLSYRSSRIHYYRWGTGPRIIFAFHGYGETASSFAFIGEALTPDFSLVAIDLPFHGSTEWNEGLSFLPEQLYEIMKAIAAHHAANMPSPGPTSHGTPLWRLLGYSMGGRIVLQLLEYHPRSFDKLILLAPDGMKVNSWYRVATGTIAGNLLFRWTMRWPGWLFLVLRLCHFLRLVNPSIYKFAVHYIDDRRVRQDLYTRWTVMRLFRPRLATIAAIIRRQHVPVSFVYGRFDRIIRWETAERFRNRGIGDQCQLILLETGHQLVRPQFLPDLLPVIITP
jgi:pimeloyl-ACP methyl ester carboxylesterase